MHSTMHQLWKTNPNPTESTRWVLHYPYCFIQFSKSGLVSGFKQQQCVLIKMVLLNHFKGYFIAKIFCFSTPTIIISEAQPHCFIVIGCCCSVI